jgi:hypothetical protein
VLKGCQPGETKDGHTHRLKSDCEGVGCSGSSLCPVLKGCLRGETKDGHTNRLQSECEGVGCSGSSLCPVLKGCPRGETKDGHTNRMKSRCEGCGGRSADSAGLALATTAAQQLLDCLGSSSLTVKPTPAPPMGAPLPLSSLPPPPGAAQRAIVASWVFRPWR